MCYFKCHLRDVIYLVLSHIQSQVCNMSYTISYMSYIMYFLIYHYVMFHVVQFQICHISYKLFNKKSHVCHISLKVYYISCIISYDLQYVTYHILSWIPYHKVYQILSATYNINITYCTHTHSQVSCVLCSCILSYMS